MVYAFTVLAALIVATGETLQQRLAAQAPPEENLSPKLLLWLASRPRWLAGVGCSLLGNLLFAVAVSMATVIRVEAVFVIRLVFALTLAAMWGWHRVPIRDVLGAVTIVVGVVAFLLTAQPGRGSIDNPSTVVWMIGIAAVGSVVTVLTLVARRLRRTRRATLLGAGAGITFGLQSSLVRSAVGIMGAAGLVGLLTTWHGYAVVVVALSGMLLVQSAFESASLAASYPAVVIGQLMCSIALGTFVLGGVMHLGGWRLAVMVPALAAMIVGIFVLTRSPLVTGQPRPPTVESGQEASRLAQPTEDGQS